MKKDEGHMISDSTTRRGVGQFIEQGIHIGQNTAFPLPLLGIRGEMKRGHSCSVRDGNGNTGCC